MSPLTICKPIGLFVMLVSIPLYGAQNQRHNPGSPCGDQSKGLPDFYYEQVTAHIEPPSYSNWLVRISVGSEKKIVLGTDGNTFELWRGTPEVGATTINQFLLDLDQACKLPPDPADAAAMIKIKWEKKSLSFGDFADLHRDLLDAMSDYLSSAGKEYTSLLDSKLLSLYLDTPRTHIVYDNHTQHIEADVWESGQGQLIEWTRKLKELAQRNSDRSYNKGH